MLAAIYLSMTAKSISLRRLLALFIVALTAADFASVAFRANNPLHIAFIMAGAITLIAWSAPLMLLAYDAIYRRAFRRPVLLRVSWFVRWTYCFVAGLVLASVFSVEGAAHEVTVGGLLRPLILIAILSAALYLAIGVSRR